MIAPQAAIGIDPNPSRDVLRANQLLEAGLWLRLGGDDEGARRLFMRALSHDPTHRRAKEWLAKSAPVRPVADAAEFQHDADVSIILLDEGTAASAMAPGPCITADVLDFLAEGSEPEPAPEPKPEPAPRFEVAPTPAEPKPVHPLMPVRALTPVPVLGQGLATVAPVAPPVKQVTLLLQGVEELLSLGDASSAMELLGKAEAQAPGEPRVVAARERSQHAQQAALEAKLGDLKRVPTVRLSPKELMQLKLDARAGFVLSRLDGRMSCEAVFSVSGMSRLDTMHVLAQLLDQDVITLR
ncbi:hypothetical protein [Archangium sp.]|uniref:hypothetical protein n=1 Tax=Archangium sp. TaxID=1872627 RepID=UPI00286A8ABD|nr:hypothetical protein [Archangium sp.]